MRTVLSGEVHVRFGQIYVESTVWGYAMDAYFAGQTNGLCGAGAPGGLFLNTGLHTGFVDFTVEIHDTAPPADERWEDVVEASFRPRSAETLMVEWAGEDSWELELEQIDYRVRYCASGMDAARAQDTRAGNAPGHDRYLLQFWPARPAGDRVVKQTSDLAAYWHEYARELPSPPTARERLRLAERYGQPHEIDEDHLRQQVETAAWNGRLPTDRLRELGGDVLGMVTLDRDLLDEVEGVPPTMQRAIARWAAYRAYSAAGLTGIDWIRNGLDALDRGLPLPPPFDDLDHIDPAWDALFEDARVPHTVVSSLEGSVPYMLRQAMALPALFGAAHPDPLRAALDALYAAASTFGPDYPALFAQVRLAFPLLTAYTPPPIIRRDPWQGLLAELPELDEDAEDAPREQGPSEAPGAPPGVPGARKPETSAGSAAAVD